MTTRAEGLTSVRLGDGAHRERRGRLTAVPHNGSRRAAIRTRILRMTAGDTPPGGSAGAVPTDDSAEALRHAAEALVPSGRDDDGLAAVTSRHGLPGFDVVAVLRHTDAVPVVVTSSSDTVEEALGLEAELGEGPAATAAATEEVVVCRDLRRDRRWPAFRHPSVGGRAPLRRWVVVPLGIHGEAAMGSLVLAAARDGIVTPEELATIGSLADHASLVLTAYVGAGREARAVLNMDDVRVVAIAVGRLMEAHGVTEPQALAWLKDRAHSTGVRLPDVAQRLAAEGPA